MKSYYKLLRVRTDSSPEKIKKNFTKKFSKFTRGTMSQSKVEKIKSLHQAYITLITPERRHAYDLEIGLIDSPNDEAKWREHYVTYTKAMLEKDLALADQQLEKVLDNYDDGPSSFVVLLVTLILAVIAFIVLVAGKHHMEGGDPRDIKGMLEPIGVPEEILKKIPTDEEMELEKQRKEALEKARLEREFQLPVAELELVKELPAEEQKKIDKLFRDMYQLSMAPGYLDAKQACSQYFEEVSIATELETKYVGVYQCLTSYMNN